MFLNVHCICHREQRISDIHMHLLAVQHSLQDMAK